MLQKSAKCDECRALVITMLTSQRPHNHKTVIRGGAKNRLIRVNGSFVDLKRVCAAQSGQPLLDGWFEDDDGVVVSHCLLVALDLLLLLVVIVASLPLSRYLAWLIAGY